MKKVSNFFGGPPIPIVDGGNVARASIKEGTMISGGHDEVISPVAAPAAVATAPAPTLAPAAPASDPKPSPIGADAQSKIAQLAQEKCGADKVCRAQLNALVEGIHKVCDDEPANSINTYRQFCLLKQLTNPNATPKRVFPFENRTATFLEHFALLQGAPAGGAAGGAGTASGGTSAGASAGGAGAGAAGGTNGGGNQQGSGAAVGEVPPIKKVEYDTDGYRVRAPFVPSVPEQSRTDVKVAGGLQLDVQRGQDAEGKDYSELLYAPSLSVTIPLVKRGEWTMDAEIGGALATLGTVAKGEPAALVKSLHPRFPITADSHQDLLVRIPLDRNNSVVIPEVNLIQKNSAAKKLEEVINNRWGWSRLENEKENNEKWGNRAADIYLNSVLRPVLANAKDDGFDATWQAVVTTGAKRYEEFFGGKLPVADEANLWADLFQYDPMGLVDAVALWAGKKSEEVKKDLEGKANLAAFQENKAALRVDNFKNVLEAVRSLNYIQAYQLPSGFANQPNPAEEKKPDLYDRKEGYALALEEHKGAVAKAVGMEEPELDKVAIDAKIPNPFDLRLDKDPGNAWAAQKIWNDYVTALFKKKVPDGEKGEGPKWFLILKGGWQDYGSDSPGLGISGGVEWAPKEGSSVSVLVYGGFSRGNWIEMDSDTKPSVATDGGALGVTGSAAHVFYKSKEGVWRSVSAKAGFSYATAGTNPEPAGNIQDVFTVPGLGVDTTLHLGVDIDVGAFFAFRQRWPIDGPANFRKILEAHLAAHLTDQTSLKLTGIHRLGAPAGDHEERSADQPFSRRGQRSGLSSVLVGEDFDSIQALLEHKFNESFVGNLGVTFLKSCNAYSPICERITLFTLGGSIPQ